MTGVHRTGEGELVALRRQLADHAMAMDLLSRLAGEMQPARVVRGLLDLVFDLCAPAAVAFTPVDHGVTGPLVGLPDAVTAARLTSTACANLGTGDDWSVCEDGLALRVRRGTRDLGLLAVGGLAIPERRDDYLNLLLAGRGVMALALENARTHELLREREERFRLLAENATDLVLLADGGGVVRWLSPSLGRVLGWEPEQVLGERADALVHPDDREASRARFRTAVASGAPYDGLARIRTADRGYRWMALHVAPMRPEAADPSDAGTTDHVIGLRDVDDVVRARQAAEDARRAERLTRMSIDGAAIAMALLDADGTLRTVNPALCRMLAATPDQLTGRSFLEVTHPDDRPADLSFVDDLVAGRTEVYQRRVRSVRTTGEVVWGDLSLTCIPAEGREPDTLVVQIVDVTAEVRSLEALHHSMTRFQMLAENASDVVYQTDPDGTVEWVSPSVRTVLGWRPDLVSGVPARTLVHPDDRAALDAGREAVRAGHGAGSAVVRFRCADGTYRWMSLRKRPILDATGAVTGIVSGLRDVTEERAVRDELERRERQFRLAMDGAPQGMALADVAGRLLEVNPALARLLGTTAAALAGLPAADLVHPEDAPTVERLLADLVAGRADRVSDEHRLRHGDREVWVEHSTSLLRDPDGSPQLFVHQFTDETADRDLRAELAFRASHDGLTGLSNRQALMDRLCAELASAREAPDRVGILFCDVDNLKPINDAHGHLVGDAVLSEVAERLVGAVRGSDLVGRVGGDEFVVLLDHAPDLDALARVAEKIRTAVSRPVEVEGASVPVSISLGATVAAGHEPADAVMERADHALYVAKQAGRNRIHVEPPD